MQKQPMLFCLIIRCLFRLFDFLRNAKKIFKAEIWKRLQNAIFCTGIKNLSGTIPSSFDGNLLPQTFHCDFSCKSGVVTSARHWCMIRTRYSALVKLRLTALWRLSLSLSRLTLVSYQLPAAAAAAATVAAVVIVSTFDVRVVLCQRVRSTSIHRVMPNDIITPAWVDLGHRTRKFIH